MPEDGRRAMDERPGTTDTLVAGYFARYAAMRGDRSERLAAERTADPAADSLDDAFGPGGDPEAGWPLLIALIEHAPDDEALAFVAAGPLEDLIRHHGPRFGERLVDRARQDERFREAIRLVWGLDDLPEPLRGSLLALLA
jgi:hypothetical protein